VFTIVLLTFLHRTQQLVFASVIVRFIIILVILTVVYALMFVLSVTMLIIIQIFVWINVHQLLIFTQIIRPTHVFIIVQAVQTGLHLQIQQLVDV